MVWIRLGCGGIVTAPEQKWNKRCGRLFWTSKKEEGRMYECYQ